MSGKFSLLTLLMCGALIFASCDDDNNNYLPDQAVTTAFNDKYPDAKHVEWETKVGYQVADFRIGSYEAEAWFDDKGNWFMTETDIAYKDLPAIIQASFEKSEYATWKKEDIDKLERAGFAVTYVIEVEQGENEMDLQYAEDGTLVKAVPGEDNKGYLPEQLPMAVADMLNEMYPGAIMLEYDKELKGIEVDILHEGIHKEVAFNSNDEWVYTEWDIRQADIPSLVMNTFKASEYGSLKIDDIDAIEKPDGIFYIFEVERNGKDILLTISEKGHVIP